ncbi:hypothetical protein [Dasania marina]|uniref:hypothetical protein n=1 Tax=Dasania marina TaxID=471499 RepID=UPI0030DAC9B1
MQCLQKRLAYPLAFFSLMAEPLSASAEAESTLSAGVWGNYKYLPGDKSNTNSGGEFTDEALIIYADGDAKDEGDWLYSAEMRIGPGSFTDPDNNSSGSEFALHKAWVGWRWGENSILRVGKSQLPFGWKTSNFWPGDMLLAGYGDQMDVGVKLSHEDQQFHYDLAFYLSDDWGGDSTDTLDDNGHWGSSTTYRKVQTWVTNVLWQANEQHAIGLSLQSGQLQDLTGTPDKPTSGTHQAFALYYLGEIDNLFLKASYIQQSRDLPKAHWQSALLPETIKNNRLAAEIGYRWGPWTFYLDATAAQPKTKGSRADTVTAYVPGVKYDYGPGWIYVEYLQQNGFVDRNGQVGEGDFDALYITLDFYL